MFGNTNRHHLLARLMLVAIVGGDVVILRTPFIRMEVRVQEMCSVEVRTMAFQLVKLHDICTSRTYFLNWVV